MPPKGNNVAAQRQASRLRNLASLIQSDSSSYGSEGEQKEKQIQIKKRGGKKRNKNQSKARQNDSNSYDSSDSQSTIKGSFIQDQSHKITETQQRVLVQDKIDLRKLNEQKNDYIKQKSGLQENLKQNYANEEQSEPDTPKVKLREEMFGFENPFKEGKNKSKNEKGNAVQNNDKSTYQRGRVKQYSPPMIQEYDPTQDNAKKRAEKRKEELKKRKEDSPVQKQMDIDIPQDPRPWKGKPSEFFIVHAPRRGTHKVLNNAQKDFLLIYYPDCVVDHISFIEFLYKQAKEAEDRDKQNNEEKHGTIIRNKAKKKQRNYEKPQLTVLSLSTKEVKDIKYKKALNFEQILQQPNQIEDDYSYSREVNSSNDQLYQIQNQIQKIQQRTNDQIYKAQQLQSDINREPIRRAMSRTECSCHESRNKSNAPIGYNQDSNFQSQLDLPSSLTTYDDTEIQRQNILRQICDAKKRQARLEADEARRLQDEARRMAEQARIYELESQRPYLEARRLEQEAIELELQFQRMPQHLGESELIQSRISGTVQYNNGNKQQYGLDSLYGDTKQSNNKKYQNTASVDCRVFAQQSGQPQNNYEDQYLINKKNQLLEEARQTQLQLEKLKQQAARLEQQQMAPKQIDFYRKQQQQDWRGLNEVIENPKPIVDSSKPKLVVSSNSLAARKAAEQKKVEEQKKIIAEKAKSEQEMKKYEALVIANRKKQEKQNEIFLRQQQLAQPNIQKIKAQRQASQHQELSESEESQEEENIAEHRQNSQIIKDFDSQEQQKKQKSKSRVRIRDPSESPEQPDEDPMVLEANEKLERARKALEKAQLQQEAAQLKKEQEIKKQQEEIEKAQLEAKKYFELAKKKQVEEKKQIYEEQKINSASNEQFGYNINDNDNTNELLKYYERNIQSMKAEKTKIFERFQNREKIWEYLGPILSGKLLHDFNAAATGEYVNFSKYYIEDNFYDGHSEYFLKWRYLFLFETYSFLMNSRWSKFTGSEIELKNQILQMRSEKSLCWKGYFQFKELDGRACILKMMKEPPGMNFKKKNFSKIYEDPNRHEGENFELSHCREEDLIIISKFRINLEGQEDIKMVSGGAKFLREVLGKQGVMFGFINKMNNKLDNFVEVIIDSKYAQYFQGVNEEQSTGTYDGQGRPNMSQATPFTRYCYFFENLLTGIREFKSIKALEFTRFSPILCYPSLSIKYRDKIIEQHNKAILNAFPENFDQTPKLNHKFYQEDEEKQLTQMNNYLIQNHQKFNQSQAKVLEQVIEMPLDQIMLIQGPPGTGKTQTIIGIISMIMSTRLANSKQKIMVCAPSNAAIDQIILRIIEKGLIGVQGLKQKTQKSQKNKKDDDDDTESSEEFIDPPDLSQSLIRITSAEYHTETAIKKHTLEQRIIKKLSIEKFSDLKKCIKEIKEMIQQLADFDAWEEYPEFPFVNSVKFRNYTLTMRESYLKKMDGWGDITMNRSQQTQIMDAQLKMHERELNEFKSGQNVQQGNPEWKEAERQIINECNIVCCTLSMAGSSKLDPFVNSFEYLIVDEACQSTEPSTLIPFRLAPKRVILVGDQKQLPATTFSGNSEKTGYCRSMFERLLDSGFDKIMLTIQFRMHPKIRAFPSEQFYDGAISDHPSIGYRSAPLTITNLTRVFSSRMIFFDIEQSEEVYDNKSKCNLDEADFTKQLVEFMARKMSLQGTLKYVQGQIGVISPYKAQVKQLYQRLEKLCADQVCSIHETIEVNTVDAFQGSEKDIIIFNCVRSNSETIIEKSLGFLLDERRLNVALTRPKFFLMIVGNSKTLKKADIWDNMINYCISQGKYISITDRSQFQTAADFKQNVMTQFLDEEDEFND